jgi:proton-coupled amino acid transporter
MLFPAIQIIETALARRGWLGDDADGYVARRNAVRAAVVATTLGVSLGGAGQLDNFVSLIGCFCCTPLAFIYPCLFHLRLNPGASSLSKAADAVIVALGVGVFVFSTYMAVSSWGTSSINPCVSA